MNDMDAREAMARVLCQAAGLDPDSTNMGIPRWDFFLERAEDCLAADPLRKALGPAAILAILKGEAGVFRCTGTVNAGVAVTTVRLDTPTEAA